MVLFRNIAILTLILVDYFDSLSGGCDVTLPESDSRSTKADCKNVLITMARSKYFKCKLKPKSKTSLDCTCSSTPCRKSVIFPNKL